MGREEQIEERDVLGSIFPDEITGRWFLLSPLTKATSFATYMCFRGLDISDTSYKVSIALLVDQHDEDGEDLPDRTYICS